MKDENELGMYRRRSPKVSQGTGTWYRTEAYARGQR